jgi:hypothetical protein
MVIFFTGAYSCTGFLNFDNDGLKATYDKFIGNGNDVSSCVPIFINKMPEIDHAFI